MAYVNYYTVSGASQEAADAKFATLTKDQYSFYLVYNDLYIGDRKLTNSSDLSDAIADIAQNAADIATIQATLTKLENTEATAGSIRNIIKSYFDALTAADVPIADTAGNFDATDVEAALSELFAKIGTTDAAGQVTVETTPVTTGMLRSYNFYQGLLATDTPEQKAAKKVVTIDIPKDLLAVSGSVVTYNTGDTLPEGVTQPGTYLALNIGTAASDVTSTVYVDVASLIEYVTGGSTAEITVAVDPTTHVATATVNKIAASKVIYQAADAEHDIPEITVAQKLNTLDSLKADKSQLVATEISHTPAGDGASTTTVSAELIAQADDIDDLTDLVGQIPAGATSTNVVDYISEVSAGNVDGLDSSIASTAGSVLTGLTITAGKLSAKTEVALDAQNTTYTSNAQGATQTTVKAALDNLANDLSELDAYVGDIPATSTASSVVEFVTEKIGEIEQTAENTTVADANNYFDLPASGTKNVESSLQQLATHMQWREAE